MRRKKAALLSLVSIVSIGLLVLLHRGRALGKPIDQPPQTIPPDASPAAIDAPAFAQFDSMPVGDLGNTQKIVFDGCKQVSVQRVRQAIANDASLQLASTPSAPLGQFLRSLQERLTLGYLDSGFPKPRVTVRVNTAADQIAVAVDEGPRYECGEIRVSGAHAIDAQRLIRELTAPGQNEFPIEENEAAKTFTIYSIDQNHSPDDSAKAAWKIGEVASFTSDQLPDLTEKIHLALYRQGYFWAQTRITQKTEKDRAILEIQILQEGAKATLARVNIHGQKSNSEADVLNFLNLTPGMPIDLDRLQMLQQQLWDSARFLHHTLRAKAGSQPGELSLDLELDEAPDIAPLGKPLSPVQQALLRCVISLEKAVKGDQDIVLEAHGNGREIEIALNARQGMVMRLFGSADGPGAARPSATSQDTGASAGAAPAAAKARPAAPASAPASQPADFEKDLAWMSRFFGNAAVVVDRNHFGVYLFSNHRKFVGPLGEAHPFLTVSWLPYAVESPGRHGFVSFGMGVTADPSVQSTSPQLHLHLAPVSALSVLEKIAKPADGQSWGTPRVSGGVLRLSSGSLDLSLRDGDGQLQELSFKDGAVQTRIALSPGTVAREATALESIANIDNQYKSGHIVSSYVGFLNWMCQLVIARMNGDQGASRLAAADVFSEILQSAGAPLEALVTDDSSSQNDQDFGIPYDRKLASANPMHLMVFLIPYFDRTFERGSWPWTLARQGTCFYAGYNQYTGAELQRIVAQDRIGPVGCLLYSLFFSRTNPRLSRVLAQKGLDKLDIVDFESDCKILFGGDSLQARVLQGLLQKAAELRVDQIDTLVGAFAPPAQKGIRSLLLAVRQQHPKNIDQLLPLFDNAWRQFALDYLKAELTRLAQPPANDGGL